MTCALRWTRQIPHLAAILFLAVAAASAQQQRVVRIGIVLDGPSDGNDKLLKVFREEISVLFEGEFSVEFPAEKQLQGDWTAAGVKAAVDQLLADPEVDLVLTLGVLGSNDLGHRGPLPKPGFGALVLEPEVQGIPMELRQQPAPAANTERYFLSGVPNLSYVTEGGNLLREVSEFRRVVPFSRLTILHMESLVEAIPDLKAKVQNALASLKLQIEVIGVGSSWGEAMAKIPADTEAVYVSRLPQLPSAEFDRLVKVFIDRKLPSYSNWGLTEVEQGLLTTLWPTQDLVRRARRIALNMQQVLTGEGAADLPVGFRRQESLSINMATARAIDVSPTFQVLIEANLLNDEETRATRSISLSDVVREASMVNLDLALADRNVAAGLRLVREARAPLLPQVGIAGEARVIDQDRAALSFGLDPERLVAGSASARQLIYDDDVKANWDIERNLQESRREERAQVRLDVILEAATSYLKILRTKTIEQIQKDNLWLSRANLELARSRVEIGQAGRDELFRWQSQIAINRRDVVDSIADRDQSEIIVNRVLNRPISEKFLTVEAGLNDPQLLTSFEQLRPYVESPAAFELFRAFMVQEAFDNSPELRQLDAQILAQQRELLASRRDFYVPDVKFNAEITSFSRNGAGSKPELFFPGPLALLFPNNTNWFVGARAELPIFTGLGRVARRSRAEVELDRFGLERDATQQRVEERIRAVLHQTNASFLGIDLTRAAAEAARSNLDLVTDQYAQGIVEILRLLDAQNQTLNSDLAATNAVFDYLVDLMTAQRAVGRFDYYRSVQDRQIFLNRLDEFFRNAGYAVRRP